MLKWINYFEGFNNFGKSSYGREKFVISETMLLVLISSKNNLDCLEEQK